MPLTFSIQKLQFRASSQLSHSPRTLSLTYLTICVLLLFLAQGGCLKVAATPWGRNRGGDGGNSCLVSSAFAFKLNAYQTWVQWSPNGCRGEKEDAHYIA